MNQKRPDLPDDLYDLIQTARANTDSVLSNATAGEFGTAYVHLRNAIAALREMGARLYEVDSEYRAVHEATAEVLTRERAGD